MLMLRFNVSMKIKKYKDITAVSGGHYIGMRFMCNIPPEEMEKRKEEILKNVFEKWSWECSICNLEQSSPSTDLNGYWYYMVDFKG